MNTQRTIFILLFLSLFSVLLVFSQQDRGRVRGYSSQQEIVNMDSTTRMDQALLALSEMSKKFAGKAIIDLEKRTNPIGIDVINQHWRDALEMILTQNAMWYREDPDYLLVMTAEMARSLEGAQAPTVRKPTLESREVLITTTFISIDLTKSTNLGVDWSLNYTKDNDTLGFDMFGSVAKSAFDVNYGRSFKRGSFSSLLQFYSQNGIADVIASPRLSITSGDSGIAQVGQDISVPRRDVSGGGNLSVSVQQIPTGTIVRVKPEIIHEDTIDFIWVDLEIERSFVVTTGELPIIDRNKTRTKLLLIDGEEAFLSGLYYNQTSIIRTGIPYLKDLPPWVLGLRYIFGSDETTINKRELAILIKVEILPSLRERSAKKGVSPENLLEKMRKGFDKDVQRLTPKREEEK
ncbi:MAG: hypothetical protein EPO24_01720 [Bacteroidetes bacterium]|nr:MAG: hypothetical protein EPO24_01720 [Bacteroidota bacterium]